MLDIDNEPFYKWYYRQQTPLKKLKLRWNWFLHGNTIGSIRTFFDKFKYGWSYDGNTSPEIPEEDYERLLRVKKLNRILDK